MKMTGELAEAFNRQISMEVGSSLAYLQMSAHLAQQNLTGMALWLRLQAEEEWEHAHRFYDFVLSRGHEVRIGGLEAPGASFESVESVFVTALQQEQGVTEAIHRLYRLATDHDDVASFPFLQSFIEEQNEEEATVETILERVRLAAGDTTALLLLDNELGGRQKSG